MNERNVAAIADAIRDITKEEIGPVKLSAEQWAAELANRGALMPSSLTDEDAAAVGRAEARSGFLAVNVQAVLERIAKGEA